MRVESLREQVLEANLELVRRGLVLYTFGNASGISRQEGLIAIKPSGVPYEQLTPEQIVVTDLAGNVVEGDLRPSSDLPTHVELYRQFPSDRRSRSHALRICYSLGAGAAFDSMLWDDARRLFQGARACDQSSDR